MDEKLNLSKTVCKELKKIFVIFHVNSFVSSMNCAGPKCEFCIQDVYSKGISYLKGIDEWHYTMPCQWEDLNGQRAFVLQINQIGCISKREFNHFRSETYTDLRLNQTS